MDPRPLFDGEAQKITQRLTYAELSERTGIHPTTLSHIFRGRVSPTTSERERLARVSVDDVMRPVATAAQREEAAVSQ